MFFIMFLELVIFEFKNVLRENDVGYKKCSFLFGG